MSLNVAGEKHKGLAIERPKSILKHTPKKKEEVNTSSGYQN